MANKRLYRSRDDRVIAGVAGGLAEYFEIDSIIIRLLFVLLAIGGGSGVLIYIICWVIIPEEPVIDSERVTETIAKDAPKSTNKKDKSLTENNEVQPHVRESRRSESNNATAGLILFVLGILFLLQNVIGISMWHTLWPLILVAIGISLILRSNNHKR